MPSNGLDHELVFSLFLVFEKVAVDLFVHRFWEFKPHSLVRLS